MLNVSEEEMSEGCEIIICLEFSYWLIIST